MVNQAAQALRDPENQQRLLDAVRQGSSALSEWRASQAKARRSREPGDEVGPRLWVVHRRLERRERGVRSGLDAFVSGDPAFAAQLRPVYAALDGVLSALVLSEGFGFASRRKAHRAVSEVLDQIEDDLLSSVLGSLAAPAGETS